MSQLFHTWLISFSFISLADIDLKVQVNSSIEGKANENSTDVSESDNAMPLVNFSGYVGSQHKKAGDTAACVASSGVGIPSDVFGLVSK